VTVTAVKAICGTVPSVRQSVQIPVRTNTVMQLMENALKAVSPRCGDPIVPDDAKTTVSTVRTTTVSREAEPVRRVASMAGTATIATRSASQPNTTAVPTIATLSLESVMCATAASLETFVNTDAQ
jgi:hypothetical protein